MENRRRKSDTSEDSNRAMSETKIPRLTSDTADVDDAQPMKYIVAGARLADEITTKAVGDTRSKANASSVPCQAISAHQLQQQQQQPQSAQKLALKEIDDLDSDNNNTSSASFEAAFMLALESKLDQLNAEGLFKLASAPTVESVENEIPLDKFIQDLEEYLEIINVEDERWDKLLADHEKLVNSESNGPPKTTINAGMISTNSAGQEETPGSDCKHLVEGLNVKMQRLKLQMKTVSRATETLCLLTEKADEQLTKRVHKLDGRTESIDCKQLVKAILDCDTK